MRFAFALCFVVVALGCAHEGMARWDDVDKSPKKDASANALSQVPATGDVPATPAEPVAPEPPPPPPPPPPTPAATGSAGAAAPTSVPIVIDGKNVDDGAFVEMPSLELACMPAADALTDVNKARARFDKVAEKLNVPVGRVTFVLLERDPARSITDPPPRLCWNIPSSTALKAPLFREREVAAKWLVRRIVTNLVDDAGALVHALSEKKLDAIAAPRVIVDDKGALVAVALPVKL